jgi:hypothetical protein
MVSDEVASRSFVSPRGQISSNRIPLVVCEMVQPKSGLQRDVAVLALELPLKECHETVHSQWRSICSKRWFGRNGVDGMQLKGEPARSDGIVSGDIEMSGRWGGAIET